jgi:uncharacterized protein YunC (DUF1805 family)
VNLVFATGSQGMLACGAIDVAALQNFGYPAARVRPANGPSIATVADLLAGIVKEANPAAGALGVAVGMSGADALERLA